MNEIKEAHQKALLQNYLLNLIAISTDILKDLDNYMLTKESDDIGKLVANLAEFRKNNMIKLPF